MRFFKLIELEDGRSGLLNTGCAIVFHCASRVPLVCAKFVVSEALRDALPNTTTGWAWKAMLQDIECDNVARVGCLWMLSSRNR